MKFRQTGTALVLAAAMMLPGGMLAAQASDTPAGWAQDAVASLQAKQVLRQESFGNYDAPITRGDFAYLGVRVYELLSGNSLQDKNVSLNNIFLDTNDEYVRKAFYAGIVQGYGGGIFGVGDGISREQIATLLVNAVERAGNDLAPANVVFEDQWQISGWAAEAVQKAVGAAFIRGTGNNCVSPQEGATREQALVMVNNILANAGLYAENHTDGVSPALKWAYGGTQETWCPEAYYSTPTVRDFDRDGNLEVVAASSTVFSLDANSGKLKFRAGAKHDMYSAEIPTGGRVWTDALVRDIDGDGQEELIAGFDNGVLAVYDAQGHFKPGWPQSPQTNPNLPSGEYRALKVADIDGDGKMEIIAGAASERGDCLWVFKADGSVKPGWPRLDAAHDGAQLDSGASDEAKLSAGYAWGFFNNTLAVGDLTGTGGWDIVAPSDVPFVCVYDADGNLRPANAKWGGRTWGKIGFWESADMEDRNENEGWGLWPLKEYPYHEMLTVNFAHAGSLITDLDGNGKNELVVTGNVYDTSVGHPPVLYTRVFVLHGDRTRWSNGTYDWRSVPATIGAPLNEDYYQIESCMSDPLAEDIDGDGRKEIIVPASDGKLHCYWLDKEEKGNFPVSVYDGQVEEYASKPAAADLNGDGKKELVFTTWTRKDSGKQGSLYIVDANGQVLKKTKLPFSLGSPNSNGCLAAPLLQDMDVDGKYEIILNTVYSGVVVYDL